MLGVMYMGISIIPSHALPYSPIPQAQLTHLPRLASNIERCKLHHTPNIRWSGWPGTMW